MTLRKKSNYAAPVIGYLLVILVNIAANALPIAGQRTGDVSAKYASLFTPAGYTFSIWGAIYLALGCYVVYQALPAQRADVTMARIATLFSLSCVLNAAWLFAWHYELIAVSLLLMVVLLATLVRIYRTLDIHEDLMPSAARLCVNLPFGLYTAWITVATIANASAMQAALVWNDKGMSGVDWTLLKMALAGAAGAAVITLRRDIIFGIVIAWAAFGIASAQSESKSVGGAATTVGVLMIMLCLFEFARATHNTLQGRRIWKSTSGR